MPTTKAAVGIICIGSKLLMVPRTNPEGVSYETPGGHIEAGETPEETVVREIFEEANVVALVRQKIGVFHNNNSESHYFECQLAEDQKIDERVSCLVDVDELPSLPITGFAKENLEKLGYNCG